MRLILAALCLGCWMGVAAAVGLASLHAGRRGFDLAAWGLIAGSLVFSGTVAALALGAPRWLGAITPIGGLMMIAGFVALAFTAWRL